MIDKWKNDDLYKQKTISAQKNSNHNFTLEQRKKHSIKLKSYWDLHIEQKKYIVNE